MTGGTIRSSLGSGFAALPWCCTAPAVFALGGVARARAVVLASAPLVAGLWIYRLDLWPG